MLKKSLPALIFIMSAGLEAAAQTSGEVTIIAPYIPTVGDAAKIPFRPEINQPVQQDQVFEYEYLTSLPALQLKPGQVEPLKYTGDKKDQLKRNFLKAGLGNYVTPYIDFTAGSLQSEKFQFGARIKHQSSQGNIKGYPPSAYSHSLVDAAGKIFLEEHTLSAGAGYQYDVVHFYGFVPDSFPEIDYSKDDLRQRFQHLFGTVGFRSAYKDVYKLSHSFELGAHYFSDRFQTRESQFSFRAGLDKSFRTGSSKFSHAANLELRLDYFSIRDSVSSSDSLFLQIKPVYKFGSGPYEFEAGLDINLAVTANLTGNSGGIDVFPVLKAGLVVIPEKLKAYAEVSGSRQVNSFRSLAGSNPYLISDPRLTFTDERIRIGGGISGNAAGVNFRAEAFYSYFRDLPLFVTDTSVELQNRFSVIYDDISILKITAALDYLKNDRFYARLSAGYYHHIPQNEAKAWHLPGFEVQMDTRYTFYERYTVRASLLVLGTRFAQAWDNSEATTVRLGTAVDPGLGFEYRVNEMVSAYVEGNNLFNQHYQRWYGYPVQGILVMAGAKLSF